jgi:hypoxanthine-guanine phosphoribosyltransferase
MKDNLQSVVKDKSLSLYEIVPEAVTPSESAEKKHQRSFIASTPQTRSISNDPTVAGIRYTRRLREACTAVLKNFDFGLAERETVVVNILRGALNFGLRDALADAYGWYRHNTSFISAQRARDAEDSESWHITEKGYKKIYFPSTTSLVMGDVVATGTSLHFALKEIIRAAVEQHCQLRNIVFSPTADRKRRPSSRK